MIALADLASALRGHLEVTVRVEDVAVDDIVVMESAREHIAGPGDLVLGISLDTVKRALSAVDRLADRGAPALVIRSPLAHHESVIGAAHRRGLALVALAPNAGWAHLIQLLRDILDRSLTGASALGDDLFALADAAANRTEAAVTIEDAHHRVLAYSARSHGADATRVETIVGRRVPPSVVRDLRARGVFRRMTRSADPFFLAPGATPELGGRFVVPVRAGGDWLGSIWCALDQPPPDPVVADLRTMASAVALYLLDRRVQSDVTRRVWLDHLRQALVEPSGDSRAWLPPGPWRVVLLGGRPDPAARPQSAARPERTMHERGSGSAAGGLATGYPREGDPEDPAEWGWPETGEDMPAASDRASGDRWAIALRRRGWQQPAVVEVGDHAFAVVTDAEDAAGRGRVSGDPGQWRWLRTVINELADQGVEVTARTGTRAAVVEHLPRSRREALDVAELSDGGPEGPSHRGSPVPVAVAEECWAALTIARASRVLRDEPVLGPLSPLMGDAPAAVSDRHTLSAFLDHQGAPGRAAEALGIHVNTLRYRMARIAADLGTDLDDPDLRLALQLLLRAHP